MSRYYFCGICGGTKVSRNKQDLVCQGLGPGHVVHPLTDLGKGKKGRQRQSELVEGYAQQMHRSNIEDEDGSDDPDIVIVDGGVGG